MQVTFQSLLSGQDHICLPPLVPPTSFNSELDKEFNKCADPICQREANCLPADAPPAVTVATVCAIHRQPGVRYLMEICRTPTCTEELRLTSAALEAGQLHCWAGEGCKTCLCTITCVAEFCVALSRCNFACICTNDNIIRNCPAHRRCSYACVCTQHAVDRNCRARRRCSYACMCTADVQVPNCKARLFCVFQRTCSMATNGVVCGRKTQAGRSRCRNSRGCRKGLVVVQFLQHGDQWCCLRPQDRERTQDVPDQQGLQKATESYSRALVD